MEDIFGKQVSNENGYINNIENPYGGLVGEI